MAKKKLKFMQHVVYDPSPAEQRGLTEEGKKFVGTVVLFLGELPSAPGHCAIIHGKEVLWMEHTSSFRAATDAEV